MIVDDTIPQARRNFSISISIENEPNEAYQSGLRLDPERSSVHIIIEVDGRDCEFCPFLFSNKNFEFPSMQAKLK